VDACVVVLGFLAGAAATGPAGAGRLLASAVDGAAGATTDTDTDGAVDADGAVDGAVDMAVDMAVDGAVDGAVDMAVDGAVDMDATTRGGATGTVTAGG